VRPGDLQRRFGRNVRLIRTSRGLSQEQLADELGVHRTYVGGLERGERNPSLKVVEQLANKLSIDPVRLLAADFDGEEAAFGPEHTRLRAAASGRDLRARRTSPKKRARPSPPPEPDASA
jgi:transcriptional regulator with XRE-family HTH domain